MDTSLLWILGPAVLLLGGTAAGMLWALRTGRLRSFEQGARAVFTEEEPEGKVLDRFPQAAIPTKT
jgi:hypothetical protein